MDQTACGIAAEQGALGAAQHLHPIVVKHLESRSRGRGHVDVVYIHSHRRFLVVPRKVILRDAAYVDIERRRTIGLDHGDARHLRKNVLSSIPAQLLDLLTGKSADRNTYVLQALLPLLCGYNNLFQYRSVSGGNGNCRRDS